MTCHHEGMAEDMPEVLEAYAAYKQAQVDALALRADARVRLGHAIVQERQRTKSSEAKIAGKIGVVTEQVRRYQKAYNEWREKHPDEPLD